MRAIITALFLILFSQSALANYEEFFNKVPKGSIMCDNIEWFSDHPEAAAIVENGRYFSIMFPEKLKKLKIDEVVFRIDFGNLGEGYGTYMSRLKDGTLAPSSSVRFAWTILAEQFFIQEINPFKEKFIGELNLRCNYEELKRLKN